PAGGRRHGGRAPRRGADVLGPGRGGDRAARAPGRRRRARGRDPGDLLLQRPGAGPLPGAVRGARGPPAADPVKLAGAVLLVALAAAPARAQVDRPSWVTAEAPEEWGPLPGLSKSVATSLEQLRVFGDLGAGAGAQAFARPGEGAFYLSWLVA